MQDDELLDEVIDAVHLSAALKRVAIGRQAEYALLQLGGKPLDQRAFDPRSAFCCGGRLAGAKQDREKNCAHSEPLCKRRTAVRMERPMACESGFPRHGRFSARDNRRQERNTCACKVMG